MPTTATAPGKLILFGEHAVVYGQPAIAIPLTQRRAVATVADAESDAVRLLLPDIYRSFRLTRHGRGGQPTTPFSKAIRLVQAELGLDELPALTITVRSELPIASGLGSGAATAAALIRALWLHLAPDRPPSPEDVNRLTYAIETLHHGTPSGIDNTVVALERPIFFRRSRPANIIEPFAVGAPLHLVVGDTGLRSQTRVVVGDVRRLWEADPAAFDALFAACGRVALEARQAIERGDTATLGRLMDENHALLQTMTVSSAELDTLVVAARAAGALGAKLSGAGRGGNMLALVGADSAESVAAALQQAGAAATIITTLPAGQPA